MQNNYTKILFFCILIVGFFLRFYHFDTRWGFGNDDARDIVIALESIRHHSLPSIGSFSSAGPFVIGPFFYWFIIFSYIICPFVFTIPYMLLGLMSVALLVPFYFIGKQLEGELCGILAMFFAGISPQLVVRGLSLGNPSFVPFATVGILFFFFLFWKNKKMLSAFFMGICIGIAINMHYSALNVLIFLPAVFFISHMSIKQKLQGVLVSTIAIVLTCIPLILWDSHQSFANLRNILDYFLIGEYRIYVPNSWKIFLFSFYPSFVSFIIGGSAFIGVLVIVFLWISSIWGVIKKALPQRVIILLGILAFLSLLSRYYHGERTEGYLLYFNPIIILLISWNLAFWIKRILSQNTLWRYLSVCIIFLFIIVILYGNLSIIARLLSYDSYAASVENTANFLEQKYPYDAITLYDYSWQTANQSYPLSARITFDKKNSEKGRPIGVISAKEGMKLRLQPLHIMRGFWIVALSKGQIETQKYWVNVSSDAMYNDFQKWDQHARLISTFSLPLYLKSTFHI